MDFLASREMDSKLLIIMAPCYRTTQVNITVGIWIFTVLMNRKLWQ